MLDVLFYIVCLVALLHQTLVVLHDPGELRTIDERKMIVKESAVCGKLGLYFV